MDERETRELMEDVAAVMRTYVSKHVQPIVAMVEAMDTRLSGIAAKQEADAASDLRSRIREWETQFDRTVSDIEREAQRERDTFNAEMRAARAEWDARLTAVAEIERRLVERIAALKDGEPGRDGLDGTSVTIDDVLPAVLARADAAVSEAVERVLSGWDRPKDGASVTVADVEPMLREMVAALPPAKDGKDGADADPDVIRSMVAEAVAAIPAPRPGKDADPEEVVRLVAETVRVAVAALPAPEKGDPGPMGKLPVVRAWEDRVYYEGEVVSFAGGAYQALRDTGKSPDHEDWTCIVAKGRDGEDGKSFTIRGTWAEDGEYHALDVVALNGASFAAKRDEPGPCPGDGWQLIASQGKPGKPGIKGDPGVGLRGVPGPAVKKVEIDDTGLLRLVNGDGSTVDCDLYPVLSRIG